MRRVTLSTWILCSETGKRLEKDTICYQDTTTLKVYSLNSNRVKAFLQSPNHEGCVIADEDPHFETV